MQTTEEIDEALASLERVARTVVVMARDALALPQSGPLLDEIQATSDTAHELRAFAQIGQWASVESEKRASFDRAVEFAQKLLDCTKWMEIPIADLAFLHKSPRKQ